MLSRTGMYALQAVLLLARRNGQGPLAAASMAEELGIPSNYLAKTLHRLRQEGLLTSSRGAGGGFRLALPATAIPVARVLAPFQELGTQGRCLLGGACNPRNPCTAHARWTALTAARLGPLTHTTVADLLGRTPDSTTDRNPR